MQTDAAPPDAPGARAAAPVTRRQRLSVALNAAAGATFVYLIFISLVTDFGWGQFWPLVLTAGLMTLIDRRLIGPLLDRLRGEGGRGPEESGRVALLHLSLVAVSVTALTQAFESLLDREGGAAVALGAFGAAFVLVGAITYVWSLAASILPWRWAVPAAGALAGLWLGAVMGAVGLLLVGRAEAAAPLVRIFGPAVVAASTAAIWGTSGLVGGVIVAWGRLTFVGLVLPMLAAQSLLWVAAVGAGAVMLDSFPALLAGLCSQAGWCLGLMACRDSARVFQPPRGR
jgi:hypothetical protein